MKHLLYAMSSSAVWQSWLFVQPSGIQLSKEFWELLAWRSQTRRSSFWVFTRCMGHAKGSQEAAHDSHSSLHDHSWSHLSILPQITQPPKSSNELCPPLESGTQPQKSVLPFGTYRCHNPALTCSLPCSYTDNVPQPIKQ